MDDVGISCFTLQFLKIFFKFILDRGEGREKESERNINVWSPLGALHWRPGCKQHVP